MKVYNKIVIDMHDGHVIEEDSFEYDGPVAECKGGGKTVSTTVDPVYNARMAAIAEEQNKWARQMYNMFKYGVEYDPNEVDPVSGKTFGQLYGYDPTKVVSEMQLMQAQIQSELDLQPLREVLQKSGLETQQVELLTKQLELNLQQQMIQAAGGLLPLQTAAAAAGTQLQLQQYQAASGLLPLQTQAQQAGLGLQLEQIGAQRSLLPQQTLTESMGLELQRAQIGSQLGLLPEQTRTALMGLGLQQEEIGAQRQLLPARTQTELMGLGLQQAQIGAQHQLLPSQTQTELMSQELQRAQMSAQGRLLPMQTRTEMMGLGLQQQMIGAESSLIGDRTATERARLEAEAAMSRDRLKTIQERAPVVSKLYEQALSGVDVQRRVAQAQANVQQGFASAQEQATRDLSRYGVDPTSGRGLSTFRNFGLAKAAALAGASTAAQDEAEKEDFERKRVALGVPVI